MPSKFKYVLNQYRPGSDATESGAESATPLISYGGIFY